MRARIRRLSTPPAALRRPSCRVLRLPKLRLMILAAIAAALVAAAALDIRIFPEWRDAIFATGDFSLCSRSRRQNCVIDGDTIRYNGETIRIKGIDAPETHKPECERERALGNRATKRLLELVNAGPFDIVDEGGRDTDKYGRKLRVLKRGGRSLGDILIAEGLARRWEGASRKWCN